MAVQKFQGEARGKVDSPRRMDSLCREKNEVCLGVFYEASFSTTKKIRYSGNGLTSL